MEKPIIHIEHLTKVYSKSFLSREKIIALDDVTLDIFQGEILAVLGVNGAGKSTLTKCILNLVHPTNGNITFLGKSNTQITDIYTFGYLPENFNLPPYVTARSLLKSLGTMSGLKNNELEERIEYALNLFSLNDKEYLLVKKYSKGMVVRLGIAQAILHSPSLLFLDEPTDGLDPIGKVTVRNLLIELAKQGTTIVLNSHLLTEVELLAHRAAILHKGKLIQIEKLTEMLSKRNGFIIELPCFVDISPLVCNYNGKVWICEVDSARELQNLLNLINAKGIAPVNIIPKRNTLEDIFIKTIEGQ